MQENDFNNFLNALPEACVLFDSNGTLIAISDNARKLLNLNFSEIPDNIKQLVAMPEDKLFKNIRIWSRTNSPMPANVTWNNFNTSESPQIQCQAFLFEPVKENQPAKIMLRFTKGRSLARNFMELNSELDRQKSILKKLQLSRDALEQEHEKALVTLHSIGDAVITTDRYGNVEYLNPIAEGLTGWSSEEAASHPLESVFNIVNETTRQTVENPVTRCIREGAIVGLANHTVLISRDGQDYVIEDSAAPIRNKNGEILGAVLVFRDVTSDRLARRQLEYLAQHDTLTGLKNRFHFEQQLERVVNVAARGQQQSALLYVDLDQFKIVNDTAGHAAGDELLVEVARLLSERTRQGDILARLGGDEFGVIIHNVDIKYLNDISQSFIDSLRDSDFQWDGDVYPVSCSIGAMIIDENTQSSAEAMREADIACYAAKTEGRNRYHIYNSKEKISVAARGELSVVTSLKNALNKNDFLLYFQPIKDVISNRIVSNEVLLRLKQNDGSPVRPGNFIPVAERNGFMTEIDLWVLHQSISLLTDTTNDINHITVNLSGQSLGSNQVMNLIKSFAGQHPELSTRLGLEITETTAVTHIDKATQFINELRALGINFALDDFGTGFSSFAYLKHLPVDYIKIDGTFVRDIVTDPVDNAMVRSMNNIAHSLSKKTVAEFVENIDILNLLKDIGVDMVQGYYVGKPASLPIH